MHSWNKLYKKTGTAFYEESGSGCKNMLDFSRLRYRQEQRPEPEPQRELQEPG